MSNEDRLRDRSVLAALAILAVALGAPQARADVFKCKGPRGEVTYTDSPCPKGSGERIELKEPVENLGPRRPNVALPAANAPADRATGANASGDRTLLERRSDIYEPTYNERQRIENLEQIERNPSAWPEQRRSASLEIFNIRRGTLTRMSFDDLRKKDQYWADLASLDADRRRTAAMQLANLFGRYP